MSYDPVQREAHWQNWWQENETYKANLADDSKPKYYNLTMFPYPSGDRLHIGHWYNYAPVDSWGRYMKLKGYNVFQPMGFDSFGLPAENYAIKTGVPPRESTMGNIDRMREQIRAIGGMYQWSHEVVTSEPDYYRWTQWIFAELFKLGLAYRDEALVNWCPSCQTVLANEQVEDGHCERCKNEVTKKELTQWFFRISDYAEDLLDHSELDWPEKTKLMQKNWIGRSEGCNVSWQVKDSDIVLDTFTTTVDTIYGTTFVVISPEHPDLDKLVTNEHKAAVDEYRSEALKKTDIDRMAEGKEKTGVPTGSIVLNPFTGDEVPLWVADYVLMNYGTGVVMGVPAHDQRDFDFAQKYDFKIIQSIENADGETFFYDDVDKYSVKGQIIDSGEFTGLPIQEGRKKITQALEKAGKGEGTIQYKLRDWLISRQRYWGAPIPIVYDPEGNAHVVPEEHLPWTLPTDVEFKPTGTAPLAQSAELKQRTEEIFGAGWTPEVDTMDTFMCSSWYFLRFLDPQNSDSAFGADRLKNWMPVDMYIGGPEHACMHLLYARFLNMALHKMGHVPVKEPFKRLVHQGMITKDGAKMSKSKSNVVSPDDFVSKYGSDIFRMYLMFMGPFTEGGDWSDQGITGIARFQQRLHRAYTELEETDDTGLISDLHTTIAKITRDIDNMQFNTAIASLMELTNTVTKAEKLPAGFKQVIPILIGPMAPHFAEELWHHNGNADSVFAQQWPEADESKINVDQITIVVQVNGKLRDEFTADPAISDSDAITQAKELDGVKRHLEGKGIRKEIYVPGKLVNFVVG